MGNNDSYFDFALLLFSDERQYKLRNVLFSACKMSDFNLLKEGLEQCSRESLGEKDQSSNQNNDNDLENKTESETNTDKDLRTLLNEPFGIQGQTLLHIVAAAGFSEAVEVLMEAGCDPAVM